MPPRTSAASLGSNLPLPGMKESLAALDVWTAVFSDLAQESGSMEDFMEFMDRIDDFIEVETATDSERAELAAEIGLPGYIKLVRELKTTQRGLGLLGL